MMRKGIALCLIALVCALLAGGALASGATVKVYTPFADLDDSAQAFADLLTSWEEETGNLVEDHSGLIYADGETDMLEAAASGEADVIVAFGSGSMTYEQLLTAQELLELAPELTIQPMPCMREEDGSLLFLPQRVAANVLFVNRDLLEAAGVGMPSTYEELVAACAALVAQGVLPISNALSDWPENVVGAAAFASVPREQYGTPACFDGACDLLLPLVAVGGFGGDAFDVSDDEAAARFAAGKAAMRVDYTDFALFLPETLTDSVVVLPFPRRAGDAGDGSLSGSVTFGIAMTRACAEDSDRREAALSLIVRMMQGEGSAALVTPVGGALGESIVSLTRSVTDCAGDLYAYEGEDMYEKIDEVVGALKALR